MSLGVENGKRIDTIRRDHECAGNNPKVHSGPVDIAEIIAKIGLSDRWPVWEMAGSVAGIVSHMPVSCSLQYKL